MVIVKEIEMVCVEDGHNKMWICELYDNNSVITRWGKIGNELSSKMFPHKGLTFFEKKVNEKRRKGYAENFL